MSLSEELLEPIPGANPSGQNLRYVIYGAVNEARREDDEAPQGDWTHERKRADYPLVLRLCCDALAKQSKDIQLAVWATEAALKLEGLAGLRRGLDVLAKLMDKFWDTFYPELEDGDPELRSGVLESLGGKFAGQLLSLPLTRDGLTWLQYKDSRAIGYENDVAGNEDKQRAREEALSDDRISAEMFDAAASKTPQAFYDEQFAQADASLASLELLNQACQSRLGNEGPSFAGLREKLEDFRQVVTILLRKKREEEPAPEPVVEQPPTATLDEAPVQLRRLEAAAPSAPVVAPARQQIGKEPEDRSDAIERIAVAAHFLRRETPSNPVPYLILRALRWGELRATAEDLDLSLLEAPSTEIRKQLRQLLRNGEWEELLDACERTMALACARGWLDLQRYAVNACDNLGYSAVANAILSALESLLQDYPQLPQSSLNDETATANAETQNWLRELADSKQQPLMEDFPQAGSNEIVAVIQNSPPDSHELVTQAMSSGHPEEAIAILEREVAQERSGRGRFRRRVQLAQLCMAAGHGTIALPILQALAREIDDRKLEDWEDPDVLVHAFGLLYQCMDKLKSSTEQKEGVYARICRLGPAQALELAK